MIKSATIVFSSVPHLPVCSTWQMTMRSVSRLKGPRALGAVTSLALAGVLSLWTCLRSGWAAGKGAAMHADQAPVLLLTYSAH